MCLHLRTPHIQQSMLSVQSPHDVQPQTICNLLTRSNAWCSIATLCACANFQLFDACIWLAPCSNTGVIENPLCVASSSMSLMRGWSKDQQLGYMSRKIALYHYFLFVLVHKARDIGCAFSQTRLARQLKEAMAERQMAKTASKALQIQLDKLQKQVSVRRLCVLHLQLVPCACHMTVHHCPMAGFSRQLCIAMVKQLVCSYNKWLWQETCYSCNVMRSDVNDLS